MTTLDRFWDLLQGIRTVEFVSRGTSTTRWSGAGKGSVIVESPSPTILVFRESGVWCPTGGSDLNFHNVYRWSRLNNSLRLEHLRFGDDQPVYLFDLAPSSPNTWSSSTPHLCREDTYTAQLQLDPPLIFLAWTVAGPNKAEQIHYKYSP